MTVRPETLRWRELDRRHHLHPFTNHADLARRPVRIITAAEGCHLIDSEGNRILDGMSGLWCVNLDYGRRELIEAAHRQMSTLAYYNTFFQCATPPAVELAWPEVQRPVLKPTQRTSARLLQGHRRRPSRQPAFSGAAGCRSRRRHGRAGGAVSGAHSARRVIAWWGVPMATDTAFAVALIVMMGRRVPIELRIFLTAAAIVDDIGAIVVVALFYSGDLQFGSPRAGRGHGSAGAAARVPRLPRGAYMLLGVALWACVHAGGLHATLAGVILALFIPTRPPPNLKALMTQAQTIMAAEARRGGEVLRKRPSIPALRALDAIHDRLESPADRLLRHAGARSSYVVLPLFALANRGRHDHGGVERP